MAVRVNSGSDNEWHRRQGCLVNTEKCDQSCCVGVVGWCEVERRRRRRRGCGDGGSGDDIATTGEGDGDGGGGDGGGDECPPYY